MVETHKYARKPFLVDAVRVTPENMTAIADWCGGDIEKAEPIPSMAEPRVNYYVKVPVKNPMTERQSKAFIGDWILFANNGFKVYTPKAFDRTFDPVMKTGGIPEAMIPATQNGVVEVATDPSALRRK